MIANKSTAPGPSAAQEPSPIIARRGLLFVLSSPSGAGKTTLSHRLLESEPEISLSVSVTTRPPRPGEVDGQDYFFIDDQRFAQMRDSGALIEWATVFAHHYGTPRAPVEQALAQGRDVLFDIDWQGTQQLNQKLGADLVRVFILPPSATALEARLRGRALDNEDVVARRMSAASTEISHWPEYDYILINADLEQSVASLRSILAAERLKRDRLRGLADFVRALQASL